MKIRLILTIFIFLGNMSFLYSQSFELSDKTYIIYISLNQSVVERPGCQYDEIAAFPIGPIISISEEFTFTYENYSGWGTPTFDQNQELQCDFSVISKDVDPIPVTVEIVRGQDEFSGEQKVVIDFNFTFTITWYYCEEASPKVILTQ